MCRSAISAENARSNGGQSDFRIEAEVVAVCVPGLVDAPAGHHGNKTHAGLDEPASEQERLADVRQPAELPGLNAPVATGVGAVALAELCWLSRQVEGPARFGRGDDFHRLLLEDRHPSNRLGVAERATVRSSACRKSSRAPSRSSGTSGNRSSPGTA